MFKCTACGHVAYTRTSREITSKTKERYYQCTNINCSRTFVTMEEEIKEIARPNLVNHVDPHPTNNQMNMF